MISIIITDSNKIWLYTLKPQNVDTGNSETSCLQFIEKLSKLRSLFGYPK